MLDKFVNKVGLDRIAHFGVGGTIGAALALAFIYSLPMGDGILVLTWGNVNVPFVISYVIVAMMACFKEMNDETPDKWDFIASLLGVVFVHVVSLLGWLIHYGNGHDLITSTWGYIVFGVIMAVLAGLWIWWYIRFKRRK